MVEKNSEWADHEARLRMLQNQVDTLQAVVGWLIAKDHGDEALAKITPRVIALLQSHNVREAPHWLSELEEDVAFLRDKPDVHG